jgi:diamine N-acetyltransferase
VDLLSGESISLRALEPEDLELLYQWENDPTVWLLSGTMAPFSRYVLKRYLENADARPAVKGVVVKEIDGT